LLKNEKEFTSGGITPASSISSRSQKVLEDNQQLMYTIGFRGTPGIVVREGDGLIKKFNGMPRPEQMAAVVGSRDGGSQGQHSRRLRWKPLRSAGMPAPSGS